MTAPGSGSETRVLRIGWAPPPEDAANEGTRIACLRPEWMSVRGLFNAHQRQMAGALSRERRPGLMVFVLDADAVAGCLWLSATDQLRSATIGRHACADLYLPGDGALSLRHCLVLVRRCGASIRVHAVDLASSAGLRLEDGQEVRSVEADGPFFLRIPGAVLAFFPTGVPLPWNPEALPAFDSLAPRQVVPRLEVLRPAFQARAVVEEASRVTVCPAPLVVEPGSLLRRCEAPQGTLTLASCRGRERIPVGATALERGVILGRDARCAGGGYVLGHEGISRVHALLLRRDGTVFLADAGSTNGLWLGEEEFKCIAVVPGAEYCLGEHASLVWQPAR